MDRLITLEPSNQVVIRVEPGQKCFGELTLRNVMHTMPVAFRLQPMNRARYAVRPQSGIISPLATLTVEITYNIFPNSPVPESFPNSDDSFLLHSVVVPGAAVKDLFDSVPNDWFTTRKKQVFVDSGIRVYFVGSAVLTRLVADGSMEQVREVLERSNPDWQAVDSVDSQGHTLLHLAVTQSRADLVQLLLEFEPNVEAPSRAGRTPLESAAAGGEALIVELLLARRASTARSPTSSWGPLHYASGGGHVEVMRLLLLKGADVDAVTSDGRTSLHLAVEERRRDCAKLLLANGAKVQIRDEIDGDTPLHVAASVGDEQMVKLLLQGSGGVQYIRNRAGKTAYDMAAEGGYTRLFDGLKLGDRLCVAARKGEERVVGRLIERGAAVEGRDQNGWTALMRAGFKGWVGVMKVLLEKGVEVDARDGEGYTALHCAVEAGQAEAVEVLVKKGADLEARTGKGATAMQIAGALGYAGIVRILAQGGAIRDGVSGAVVGGEMVVAAEKRVLGGKGLVGREREEKGKRKGRRVVSNGGGGMKGEFGRAVLQVACSH